MDQERVGQLLVFHRTGLLEDTVPFWLKYAIDKQYGGFFNYIDYDGSVIGTDKAVWVQCRFTWLLSMLYNNVEKRPSGWNYPGTVLTLSESIASILMAECFSK